MKITIFPGKYHQNGGFSMAMLVSGRVQLLLHLLPRPFGWLAKSTHSSSSKCCALETSFFLFSLPQKSTFSPTKPPPQKKGNSHPPGVFAGARRENCSQREVIPDCEAFVEISEESLVDKSETKVVFLAFLAPRLQGRVEGWSGWFC